MVKLNPDRESRRTISGWERAPARDFWSRPGGLSHIYFKTGLFLLVAFGLIAGCSQGQKGGKPGEGQGNQAMPVTMAEATSKTAPIEIASIGTVEAAATVAIKSQVGGALSEVHFQEGQQVAKGDLLFTIDPRPYAAAVKQSEAGLERDLAQSALAQKVVANSSDLIQPGLVTAEQYDRDLAAAKAAAAVVRADRAALETARLQLSYCKIYAPISGLLGKLLVNAGNLVKANDVPLVIIVQLHPIYVNFSAPEQRLPEIRKAMGLSRLEVKAFVTGEIAPVIGELTFVDNKVDETTGTILLRATFPNQEEKLWPGQFVNLVLTLGRIVNAIVVPARAVQTGQQGQYVYVVKPDQTVEVRPVTVGVAVGDEVVIAEGLAPGLQVVTDGQLRLTPGAKVTIKSGLTESGTPKP